jgi:hypothetical protein
LLLEQRHVAVLNYREGDIVFDASITARPQAWSW